MAKVSKLDHADKLLYDFADAAFVLGTSVGTIRRLVKRGVFTPKRLNPRAIVAKLYIPAEQIHAVARGGVDVAQEAAPAPQERRKKNDGANRPEVQVNE